MWQCHCPEANTIVDRIAKEPRLQPASPRVLLDSFAVDEIDWSDKEAIDKMERDERDIREAEFLGEVSAYDPRQPDATAPSPNTPGHDSMFDFEDLDKAESEEELRRRGGEADLPSGRSKSGRVYRDVDHRFCVQAGFQPAC